MVISLNKTHLHDLQDTLQSSLTLLDKYRSFIEFYVLDFFVDDHWSQISDTWRYFIDQISPKDMAFLLDLDQEDDTFQFANVWPLEILALKASIKAYALQRRPISRNLVAKALGIKNENQEWPLDFKNLHQVFRKHIKPKKQHEIIRMADLASILDDHTNKVDLGGGLGHYQGCWPLDMV